ncbi:hypothetical protein MKX01_034066 [Papaver californicum]|nr:hypothetical protein MKX01_034066 [Papaver californicum]
MADGRGKKVENQSGLDVLMVDKYNVEATEFLANQQLLSTFKTAAKYWKQYVEANMIADNDVAAKQVFGRCLLDNRHIALWRCYIHLIRKLNDKKGAEGREETKNAFEFMLNYVGSDIAYGPVWMEYIAFLKSLPAANPQEESDRMTSIRKVYQKAIVTPTHHVEQLWKDYENFENSVSRALAKGLVSEYQAKYNSTKAVYIERKKLVDDIDWNMLAVPPTGSDKEEQQCMAWKRFLAYEKGNLQRIDSESSNSRITLTYEQCLMYLYYYPYIWYDYAKIVLPDSELLKYAYAELGESRGGDGENASALAHIQFIRFLRRTEGIEAARKYFVDARKYPNCTYHVFVAYAMMAFCQDKDPKLAHNVFEAGMKRFMHEPAYILEYADFLCRLNDDRNVCALFERALNSLPPEKSVEVWKRYTQFEQTYGNLASILKLEQRRKEALSRTDEVVSRYSFMGLCPCSSKDLDYLARQDWLVKNINKKAEKSVLQNGDAKTSTTSSKVNYPDTSRMIIYDPRCFKLSITCSCCTFSWGTGTTKSLTEILEVLPPALAAFVRHLPSVDGPGPIISDPSGATKSRPNPGGVPFKSTKQFHSGVKRKDMDRQQNDETPTQSQPLPTDLFRIRQMKKARGVTSSSQTGSASGSSGSSFSGELSGSF